MEPVYGCIQHKDPEQAPIPVLVLDVGEDLYTPLLGPTEGVVCSGLRAGETLKLLLKQGNLISPMNAWMNNVPVVRKDSKGVWNVDWSMQWRT